ncbi:MAG: DUF4291 family protein [Anaerolineae bacterium]
MHTVVERQLYAAYDDTGISVYQAFRRDIVDAALQKGTFGEGFALDRMTWIKPSFGWMLYRSGYATKPNRSDPQDQAFTCGIPGHPGESVESTFNPFVYANPETWKRDLSRTSVRHQWDPERLLNGQKYPYRRAIQIGLRGSVVENYVNKWIIGLEDMTDLAHALLQNPTANPDQVPHERLYPVDASLVTRLGITPAK